MHRARGTRQAHQVIPAEAVEAAARAAYEDVRPRMGFPTGFDEAPWPMRDTYRGMAQAALEAAAPHIRAGAKADGLIEAAEVAERGEGGGHDSGECEDWGAWLRTRATMHRTAP